MTRLVNLWLDHTCSLQVSYRMLFSKYESYDLFSILGCVQL